MRLTRALLAASLILLVPAPTVPAHGGLDCGFAGARLEGECYDQLPFATYEWYDCEATLENGAPEHGGVVSDPMFSGGKAALMPAAGCILVFHDVTFPAGRLKSLGVAINGTRNWDHAYVDLRVRIDSPTATVFSGRIEACGCVQRLAFDPGAEISAGTHRVYFEYFLYGGYKGTNVMLDYMEMGDFRDASKPYSPGPGDVGCLQIGGAAATDVGCVRFATQPGETLARLQLVDARGTPVAAIACSPDCETEPGIFFCGTGMLRGIVGGEEVVVFPQPARTAQTCGGLAAAGSGLSGVVLATFG